MHAKPSRRLYPSAFRLIGLVLLLSLVLSACGEQPTPAPTADTAAIQTQAAANRGGRYYPERPAAPDQNA